MSELAIWTLGLAIVMLVLHGTCAFSPESAKRLVAAFPRHKWAGRVLATGALLWAAWWVLDLPLGRFEYLKQWLYVVTPVTIGLSFVYLEELLAPRALGGLMLLCPAPILTLARLHESPLSLVMSLVAYVLAVKGMALVLSPYLFRKVGACVVASPATCRVMGFAGMTFDLFLVVLALAIY